MLSESLRKTVFRKFEVDELEKKTRSKDFRIQVDVGGFTLGPHPDSPKKIVTLMLYFPKEEEEESNREGGEKKRGKGAGEEGASLCLGHAPASDAQLRLKDPTS